MHEGQEDQIEVDKNKRKRLQKDETEEGRTHDVRVTVATNANWAYGD